MKLKLSTEYHCNPVWGDVDDGDFDYEELRDKLKLSSELILDLKIWQSFWDDTYIENDPYSSGFKTKEDQFFFDIVGFNLLWRLKQSLPNYQISFHSMYFKQDVIL